MNKVTAVIKNYAMSIICPIVVVAILLAVSPETRSFGAVMSLLRQSFAPAILGWGVMFNMKVGNWDFSIGARYTLAMIVAGQIAFSIESVFVALIVFFVLSMAISLVMGVIVGYTYKFLKIPTLIASIGICLIFESLTRILYNGAGVHIDARYQVFANFPWDFLFFAASFALAAFIYYKKKIGYSVRAVGTNPVVAKTNGIDAVNTKCMALIISGLFAGLYVFISLNKSGVCSAVSGTLGSTGAVFDAMMCVLIGMAICGKGNMILSLYSGAIITQVLKMGMTAVNLPTNYNKVVIAVVVIVFMVFSSKSEKIKKFFAKKKSAKA